MYIEAKKYLATFDNLLVPYSYETSYGVKLGIWISKMRTLNKNGHLGKERKEQLDEIHMVWDVDEYKWEIMYEEAQRYFEKNRHLLVEETYITKSGLELGRWIVQQRQVFKNNTSGKLEKNYHVTLEALIDTYNQNQKLK